MFLLNFAANFMLYSIQLKQKKEQKINVLYKYEYSRSTALCIIPTIEIGTSEQFNLC